MSRRTSKIAKAGGYNILVKIAALSFFFCLTSWAQSTEHILIRRLSVFPFKVPEELSSKADESWWNMRETLTKDKRFLVATKSYLQQQNVFQPREELDPAGVIVLGKLLDADAVLTTYLDGRTLHMAVYESHYGRALWQNQVQLQPSLPVADQLGPSVQRLVGDFISSIPYQGFVIRDPLKSGVTYKEGKRILVKADIGLGTEVENGDIVQLVRISSDHVKPIFTHGANIEVIAEGRVVKSEREIITAEITRMTRASDIVEKTLLQIPKEQKRLKQLFALSDPLKNKINPEFLSPDLTATKQASAEHRPLVASLVFIVNLATFLLLAF